MDKHIEAPPKRRSKVIDLYGRGAPRRAANSARVKAAADPAARSAAKPVVDDSAAKPEVLDQPQVMPAGSTLHAAAGDDDLMSTPPQQSLHGVHELEARWKQQIGRPKVTRNRLGDEELLNTEGQQHQLAALVQQHDTTTPEDARRQVQRFSEKSLS